MCSERARSSGRVSINSLHQLQFYRRQHEWKLDRQSSKITNESSSESDQKSQGKGKQRMAAVFPSAVEKMETSGGDGKYGGKSGNEINLNKTYSLSSTDLTVDGDSSNRASLLDLESDVISGSFLHCHSLENLLDEYTFSEEADVRAHSSRVDVRLDVADKKEIIDNKLMSPPANRKHMETKNSFDDNWSKKYNRDYWESLDKCDAPTNEIEGIQINEENMYVGSSKNDICHEENMYVGSSENDIWHEDFGGGQKCFTNTWVQSNYNKSVQQFRMRWDIGGVKSDVMSMCYEYTEQNNNEQCLADFNMQDFKYNFNNEATEGNFHSVPTFNAKNGVYENKSEWMYRQNYEGDCGNEISQELNPEVERLNQEIRNMEEGRLNVNRCENASVCTGNEGSQKKRIYDGTENWVDLLKREEMEYEEMQRNSSRIEGIQPQDTMVNSHVIENDNFRGYSQNFQHVNPSFSDVNEAGMQNYALYEESANHGYFGVSAMNECYNTEQYKRPGFCENLGPVKIDTIGLSRCKGRGIRRWNNEGSNT